MLSDASTAVAEATGKDGPEDDLLTKPFPVFFLPEKKPRFQDLRIRSLKLKSAGPSFGRLKNKCFNEACVTDADTSR